MTGWPILVSAVHDLIFFYKRAREAIRVCEWRERASPTPLICPCLARAVAVLASSLLADGVAECVGVGGQKEFPNLKKAREILDAVKFEAEVRPHLVAGGS